MASHWVSQNVKCPFYKETDKNNIRCEGFAEGSTNVITFETIKKQDNYRIKFCENDHTSCPYNILMESLYEQVSQ